MYFPTIKEIASSDVISVGQEDTLERAVQLMIETSHRALVVTGESENHIIIAQDILITNDAELDLTRRVKDIRHRQIPSIHMDENVLDAVQYLQEGTEYIAVIDDEKDIYGIVTHRDLVNSIDPEILMENYSIGGIVKNKKSDLWVAPTETTLSVLENMKKHKIDCAIIVEDWVPKGIFTIKDVLGIYQKNLSLDAPISEVMTAPVETICASTSIKNAINYIKRQTFKRVIVVNHEKKLMGMILQKDLLNIAYSHWASLMKQHQKELVELNDHLSKQADRYKNLAAIDPLTGLFNRYKLMKLFATEVVSMKQLEQPLSMLMIDIDFFKAINDQYGHNIGDECLKEVAAILKSVVRNIDVVSRWGGEEFVLLLPTAGIENATKLAEKIRTKIETTPYQCVDKITVSIGCHLVSLDEAIEEAISKADKALYVAKHNGRNRVECYQSNQH